jgi:DNA helicase-2/ATP-dependent DNA helicase PcrA
VFNTELIAHLTAPQKEAVLHRGSPLLIIAGPGSGKTEVIAWRVAYLVSSSLVKPENILAVTFTEKAAFNLKDRIQQKLPDINVELMHISTIHSFCADLLRRYASHSNLPHGFRILDGNAQFLFVYSNRKILGLDNIIKGRPMDFFEAVLRAFNLATEEMIAPEKLSDWYEKNLAGCCDKEKDLWNERAIVAKAYKSYINLLLEYSLVDFAFLQYHALELLRTQPSILDELHDHYQEILVDEYQDTNAIQEGLLELLAGDGQRLTVVGDDDQSIYRFRGATVRNILTFARRYPGARVVKLVHNFRSREPIIGHSLQLIEKNPARYPKDLQTVRGPGSDVLLIYEHTAAEEAQAVADLIYRLYRIGHIKRYGDAIILLRSVRSYSGLYAEALTSRGIPFQVTGDASLFQQDEIAQLYDLFNFLGTTKDWGDKSIRHPLFGLSEAACEALKAYKGSLLEFTCEEELQSIGIQDASDRRKLQDLLTLKRRVLAQEHTSGLEVLYDLLAAAGCIGRFELAGDAEALSNLGIFSHLVKVWDEYGSTHNFYPFREYLGMLREGGVDPFLTTPKDAVRILTIHQAKGLEFPMVILGSAMDGRLPSMRRKETYEIPYKLRASGFPEVEDPHLVDERKLFYVAATRARDLLVISTADVVNKRGGGPSPFLYEMLGPDLHAAADLSQARITDIESRLQSDQGPRPRHSFSQLAYYLQCPVRYKFAVIYGLEIPWLDPVDFGANVHRCLEAIHQRAINGETTTPEALQGLVEVSWLSKPHTRPEQEESYKRAAVHQLSRYLAEHGEALERVIQAETYFSIPIGSHIISGKVDLIRKVVDSEIEIVDFKTSGMTPEETSSVKRQLDLYALGIEHSLGLAVDCQTAHFLGDGQVLTWEWSPERKEATPVEIQALFQSIEDGHFSPRQDYCPQCEEFRAICPYTQV